MEFVPRLMLYSILHVTDSSMNNKDSIQQEILHLKGWICLLSVISICSCRCMLQSVLVSITIMSSLYWILMCSLSVVQFTVLHLGLLY